MTPSSIGPIRAVLASLDVDACREAADRACAAGSAGEVRAIAEALLARLEKLADLKEKGVLTEEEFAAEKARAMGEDSPSA